MSLYGKGFMIWQLARCENGNGVEVARVARAAGLSHVLIKIADGPYTYNVDRTTRVDLVPPVVQELKKNRIQAWGWHYVYGSNPVGEAQIAAQRVNELGLDGYVIDAEVEYKQPGREQAAKAFMAELRKRIPNTPVALCSYRFPVLHPQLPWKAFLDYCDYNMPQVYWQAAHNPADQLRRCVSEFKNLAPFRPIMPTGPVYSAGGWVPTESEMVEFLDAVREHNLPSVNFFAWDYGRKGLIALWNKIAAYPHPIGPQPADIPEQYLSLLNANKPAAIANLYTDDAVHITASKTVQGKEAIQTWHKNFLTNSFPNATFEITSVSGTGSTRSFTWKGVSPTRGKIENGNDTIGLIDGKIAYHYKYFKIT